MPSHFHILKMKGLCYFSLCSCFFGVLGIFRLFSLPTKISAYNIHFTLRNLFLLSSCGNNSYQVLFLSFLEMDDLFLIASLGQDAAYQCAYIYCVH